jgi:zinc transport system substrate-binding protein
MRTPLILIVSLCLFIACQQSEAPNTGVVATNAWTAAYALAAGASDVRVLTPYEMIHPSEYELRPGDITHLTDASVVIYAGYEIMIDQIRTGLKIPDDKMLQIYTSYNLEEMEASVMQIAARLGTEKVAQNNMAEIRESMKQVRQAMIAHGLQQKSAVVHLFQQSFISEAGIDIAATFGPAPPEPRQIAALSRTNATLIIDNAHNPVAGALKETLKEADYLLLLNFPGIDGTRTIQDVIQYNSRQLLER